MLRSCSYCGGIHHHNHKCASKPNNEKKKTAANKFRGLYIWRKKREEIKKRDKFLCQICLLNRHNTQRQYTTENLEVHHIEPVEKDWNARLDNSNLITLCRDHHEAAEKNEISRDELKEILSTPR